MNAEATTIAALATEYGFTLEARGDVITVHSTFQAGNVAEYIAAESHANAILREARMVYPGSKWGTDSASIGGHSGLNGGYMRLSKSGVSKRTVNALRKVTA